MIGISRVREKQQACTHPRAYITMKKTAAYITLCTLTMLCLCTSTIEVKFKMADGKSFLIYTVPRGVFGVIDSQDVSCPLFSKKKRPRLDIEKEFHISLSYIHTREEYEHFKAFWETDLAALSPEDKTLSQYQVDLTQGLFDSFLFTADFLEIQGEHAKRFTANMVRYGLLGMHSKDITENSLCKERDLAYDTFQSMLPVFLSEIGFEHRITIHSDTKKKTLLIENPGEQLKQINNEYTGVPQEGRMRTVLYSSLGPIGAQEKERNEAVLSWLLSNMGGSFIDIQYFIDIASEDISELKKTISQLTKENEKHACVYVDGLTLSIYRRTMTSLLPAFQLVPGLSRLKLFISSDYSSNTALSSLFKSITSCKSLKALEITGGLLENMTISRLVKDLLTIEQLSLSCKILKITAINNLKKCTNLESLDIHGLDQPSAVVQDLVRHFSFLKRLSIKCEPLDSTDAKSFQTCTHLDSLKLVGKLQPSAVVQEVVGHLPSLRKLWIVCNVLNSTAAESFQACKNLETLKMEGSYQPSASVKALVKHLSSLKELSIMSNSLDSTAAESFQACKNLETLKIDRMYQSSTAVKALVKHLSLLKDLKITCQTLEPAAVESFQVCKNLAKLKIDGSPQPSAVVQALVRHLSSLQELSIKCQVLEPAAAKSFEACKKLGILEMVGENQPSTSVEIVVRHLSSLKELTIDCQPLEPAAAESFKMCRRLEHLNLLGGLQPSAVVQGLVIHLLSLKTLSIECRSLEPAGTESFEACKKLEKLKMFGDNQPSSIVQELIKQLPLLKELNIVSKALEPAAAESFETCKKLEKLEMSGDPQPSTAVQELIKHLPLLKELAIECQPLEPAAAESFKVCARLEKLEIFGNESASFLIKVLEVLPSLQKLRAEIDTGSLALAAALRIPSNLCILHLKVYHYSPGFLALYLKTPLPSLTSLTLYSHGSSNSYSKEDNKEIKKARRKGIYIARRNF
ncbi:hypothetical protein NECID01_0082 [Nematocida sp. AWRm77]|nr:hypothetical protein NECID01_0082 [Nematocida sp. AWRm77]